MFWLCGSPDEHVKDGWMCSLLPASPSPLNDTERGGHLEQLPGDFDLSAAELSGEGVFLSADLGEITNTCDSITL